MKKKNKNEEDLEFFLTFDSTPKLMAYLVTVIWGLFLLPISAPLIDCSGSYLFIFLFSFVLCVLPSWVGLFSSRKKGHYILSILIVGFSFMIGLVANEGMNCRG